MTVPANEPIKIVFNINTRTNLLRPNGEIRRNSDYVSDGGKTTVTMWMYFAENDIFDRDRSFVRGFTLHEGNREANYRLGPIDIDDADVNSVSIEFGDLTPSGKLAGRASRN